MSAGGLGNAPDGVDQFEIRVNVDASQIEKAARRLVSASLGADFGPEGCAELDADRPALAALLSDGQRSLAHELMIPTAGVELLGPITSRKWKAVDDVAAELWTVDDLQFLEVSVVTKTEPEKAQHRLEQHARDGGLVLDDDQDPKTTRVLRHLATRDDTP